METTISKTATSFDAIGTAADLRSKGIEPDQAEAMAKGMNDSSAAAVVDAITAFRAEMGQLRADLRAEIAQLRAEMGQLRADLRAEIAQLRADNAETSARLQARLMTAMGICSAIIIAAGQYL